MASDERRQGALAAVRGYLRTRGLRATMRRLFRLAFARESYVLVYKLMDGDLPHVSPRIPGTIRVAKPGDLPGLRVFSHHYTDQQFLRWIKQGDCLFVFEQEKRILAYRLVTRELPRFGVARGRVHLEPSDTFVTNAYTLAAFRGARLGSALASYVLRFNQARGLRREISLIRVDNEASRKMVGLAGAVEVEEIRVMRVLGLAWYRVRRADGRRYYVGVRENGA